MSKVEEKIAQLADAIRVADEAAKVDEEAHEARWAEYKRADEAEKATRVARMGRERVAMRIRRELIAAVRREVSTIMQTSVARAAQRNVHMTGCVLLHQPSNDALTIKVNISIFEEQTTHPNKLVWIESPWNLDQKSLVPVVGVGTTYPNIGLLPMLVECALEAMV